MYRMPTALVFVCVLFAGCTPEGPPTATVQGTVTIDGVSLEKGLIQFKADTTSPTSIEIKDGAYNGTAFIGFSRVMITSAIVTGKSKRYADDENSPLDDIFEERIPPQYNAMSGMQRDIKAGKNTFDFDLTLKK